MDPRQAYFDSFDDFTCFVVIDNGLTAIYPCFTEIADLEQRRLERQMTEERGMASMLRGEQMS
jgi:hypothetical protein